MSKAKRKFVARELEELSVPTDSQLIVRIIEPRGNNLHQVVNPAGEEYIVSMPTKFRRYIWVKRGDYVLTEPIKEGDKVKGEIVKIIKKDHIRWYRAQNCWPREFDEDTKTNEHPKTENYNSTSDDEDLFVNTNRCLLNKQKDDSESDSNESDFE